MPLDLAKRGNTRKTRITYYETIGDAQEAVSFEPTHLRITQEVVEKLAALVQEIAEEQQAFWENQTKPKAKRKTLAPPRNPVIEQLVFLVTETDIVSDGKPLAPTRETFNLLDSAMLNLMLETITGTVIPEKKM